MTVIKQEEYPKGEIRKMSDANDDYEVKIADTLDEACKLRIWV
jgi:hypothetical protein